MSGRLKAAGLNVREIAASTGSARTTVYEYLVRAEGAGLSWPLPEDMDDEALEAKLFPPATAELARRRPVPEWREVHRELRSGRRATVVRGRSNARGRCRASAGRVHRAQRRPGRLPPPASPRRPTATQRTRRNDELRPAKDGPFLPDCAAG
jgi:transposase